MNYMLDLSIRSKISVNLQLNIGREFYEQLYLLLISYDLYSGLLVTVLFKFLRFV